MTSQYRVNYYLRAHKRDDFIEFIKGMLLTPFVLHSQAKPPLSSEEHLCYQNQKTQALEENAQQYAAIMQSIEVLIDEHRQLTKNGQSSFSRLARLVPSIGNFFTPLPLKDAFMRANKNKAISARRYVPPSFNDIRRILNIAQVMQIVKGEEGLQLVTFDGDMTLYDDGQNFEKDNELTGLIVGLLERNISVAVVTAAGYGEDPTRYEARLSGLLEGIKGGSLSAEQMTGFYVLGGECNFLFRCDPEGKLKFCPENEYDSSKLRAWSEDRVQRLLDIAQEELEECVVKMNLNARILRKQRAVGLMPNEKLTREQLDECALSSQMALLRTQGAGPSGLPSDLPIPFCAFNGGNDCWVDIGNKLIGVRILQQLIGSTPQSTLHIGDQFLSTGNDIATRTACCTCWIINPEETQNILTELIAFLDN